MPHRLLPFLCALSVGCSPDGVRSDTSRPRADIDSAVVGVIRTLDHSPQPDAQLRLGSNTQEADLAGMAITLHIPPGTVPASGILTDHTTAYAPVQVQSGWDAAVQLYVVPLTTYTADVVQGALALDAPDAFSLVTEDEGLWLNDAPANDALELRAAVVDRTSSLAMPGSLNALSLDTIIEPITLFHAIRFLRPSEGDWRFDTPGILTIEVDADDPVRQAEDLYWYWYSPDQGFWRRAGEATLEGDQVSGPVSLFAWWALGSPTVKDQGCVQGRVEASDGSPVALAEVLISSPERFGTRRTQTGFHGEFCIQTPLDVTVEAQVFGMSQTTGARFIGASEFSTQAAIGTCDQLCDDIGVIPTEGVGR